MQAMLETNRKNQNIGYISKVNDMYTVHLSKQALRDLKKIPIHMALKLQSWIDIELFILKKRSGANSLKISAIVTPKFTR
jgi:hypothetical protein